MENSYLKNKQILLTGGAGFLGKFVFNELIKETSANNIFVPRSKDYDLRKSEDVSRLFNGRKFDTVIHLAAKVGGIGYNMENPGSLFYDNLMMGVQLMEQARQHKVNKFVAVGTICAYPKFAPIPFKEEDIWNGYPEETNAPYGLAKKMMLVQSEAYRKQYGFNSVYLLPVNLYGPRDNFDVKSSHVIPALIKKVYDARVNNLESISVWGDGLATREFLYVEDAAKGIVLAAKHYEKPEPVNLGSGKEITIKDLITKIANIMNYKGEIKWDTTKPNGQPRRCLDVSRAEKEFGFKAKVSFDEGLRRTIDWYISQS